MNNEKLGDILTEVADSIVGGEGVWQLVLEDIFIMCITDQNNNRMRLISPIKEMKEVTDQEIGDAMEANFHSALDVRYAISNNVMWAAFIHPLKELSSTQLLDAVGQVYSAAVTFGSTYASTYLSFPKAVKDQKSKEKGF